MKEKYTKVIAIGNDSIKYLEGIKNDLEKNCSFENMNVSNDVDKEFVRSLLDGIEVLYIIYDSSDKKLHNLIKAVSFMSSERRVLSIGLDISLKENKDDLGVDKEFKLNKYNLKTTIDMINIISEAMDENTLMYIDLSDLKELFQTQSAVIYSVGEFKLDQAVDEVANTLQEEFFKSEGKASLSKGILLAETSQLADNNTLMYLNEIVNKLFDLAYGKIDIIFSYNEKDLDSNNMKLVYIRN